MSPRLLDLFCGAGGASMGYARAGFDVVGVDNEPHDDYPFRLIVADALDIIGDLEFLQTFDVIHASPPCQRYGPMSRQRASHQDLILPTRAGFWDWPGLYVIENVSNAPLDYPVMLCGSAMGLGIRCRDGIWRHLRRHRFFESNAPLMSPGCVCPPERQAIGVYGHGGGGFDAQSYRRGVHGGGYKAHTDEARAVLGIDWMRDRRDLSDAIPPNYTEYLGWQLLDEMERRAAA